MTTKWEMAPRATPEYLARWEQLRGYWRLVVTDRRWDVIDSAFTDVPVKSPHPDDGWLGKVAFVPAADTAWTADGVAWERPVCPVRAQHA